jgi:chromosome segregation ATPase
MPRRLTTVLLAGACLASGVVLSGCGESAEAKELKTIKADMDLRKPAIESQRAELQKMEEYMKQRDNAIGGYETQMNKEKEWLDGMIAHYKRTGGVTPAIIQELKRREDNYNKMVDYYNTELARFKNEAAFYDTKVKSFNSEVDSYNALVTRGNQLGGTTTSSGVVVVPRVRFRRR